MAVDGPKSGWSYVCWNGCSGPTTAECRVVWRAVIAFVVVVVVIAEVVVVIVPVV